MVIFVSCSFHRHHFLILTFTFCYPTPPPVSIARYTSYRPLHLPTPHIHVTPLSPHYISHTHSPDLSVLRRHSPRQNEVSAHRAAPRHTVPHNLPAAGQQATSRLYLPYTTATR